MSQNYKNSTKYTLEKLTLQSLITNVLIMQLWLHVISWHNPFCTSTIHFALATKMGWGEMGGGAVHMATALGCCALGCCLGWEWGAVHRAAALAG